MEGAVTVTNVFEVSDKIIEHVRMHYAEDIAIIAYYGSYAQGTATFRSDLDFFFIPSTMKGYEASIQFIVDEISFDFWPISWERAERMASFHESKTTIIADSKLLYVRSEEDKERFLKLRDTISDFQKTENRMKWVEKAESELENVYVHLYKLETASLPTQITFYRIEAHAILTNLLESLALLNQTYFTKGFGKNREQIMGFPLKPANLEKDMNIILHSDRREDILQACQQLTKETLEIILAEKEKYPGSPSYPDRLKGFYEEFKGALDKIITACEEGDYDTAFFNSIHVQDETARSLYFAEKGRWPTNLTSHSAYMDGYIRAGLPELIPLLDVNRLSVLQAAVERLSTLLEHHLQVNGVIINRFDDNEHFAAFLRDSHIK